MLHAIQNRMPLAEKITAESGGVIEKKWHPNGSVYETNSMSLKKNVTRGKCQAKRVSLQKARLFKSKVLIKKEIVTQRKYHSQVVDS